MDQTRNETWYPAIEVALLNRGGATRTVKSLTSAVCGYTHAHPYQGGFLTINSVFQFMQLFSKSVKTDHIIHVIVT